MLICAHGKHRSALSPISADPLVDSALLLGHQCLDRTETGIFKQRSAEKIPYSLKHSPEEKPAAQGEALAVCDVGADALHRAPANSCLNRVWRRSLRQGDLSEDFGKQPKR